MLFFTLDNQKEYQAFIARFAHGEDNIIAFYMLDLPTILQILNQLSQYAQPYQLIFDTREFDSGPSAQIVAALRIQQNLQKILFQGGNNELLQALIRSDAQNTIEVVDGEPEPPAKVRLFAPGSPDRRHAQFWSPAASGSSTSTLPIEEISAPPQAVPGPQSSSTARAEGAKSTKRKLDFEKLAEHAPANNKENAPTEQVTCTHSSCGAAQALHQFIDDSSVDGEQIHQFLELLGNDAGQIVQLPCKDCDVDDGNILHYLIEFDYVNFIPMFVAAGANVHYISPKYNETPLLTAITLAKYNCVETIIEAVSPEELAKLFANCNNNESDLKETIIDFAIRKYHRYQDSDSQTEIENMIKLFIELGLRSCYVLADPNDNKKEVQTLTYYQRYGMKNFIAAVRDKMLLTDSEPRQSQAFIPTNNAEIENSAKFNLFSGIKQHTATGPDWSEACVSNTTNISTAERDPELADFALSAGISYEDAVQMRAEMAQYQNVAKPLMGH